MPPSGPARLHSAALQLAASLEHMFPDPAGDPVVWRFIADGCWCDDVGPDAGLGFPMNR